MNLTEMRGVLAKRDIQLTKSLGQNFLHDANQLQRIVEAAELSKHDKVLEVGPGLGPLTELLLEKAGEVFAIEKDGRLVDFLCERFGLKSDAAETTALTLALSPEERENVEDASLSPTHPNSARSANNELPPHEPPGVEGVKRLRGDGVEQRIDGVGVGGLQTRIRLETIPGGVCRIDVVVQARCDHLLVIAARLRDATAQGAAIAVGRRPGRRSPVRVEGAAQHGQRRSARAPI